MTVYLVEQLIEDPADVIHHVFASHKAAVAFAEREGWLPHCQIIPRTVVEDADRMKLHRLSLFRQDTRWTQRKIRMSFRMEWGVPNAAPFLTVRGTSEYLHMDAALVCPRDILEQVWARHHRPVLATLFLDAQARYRQGQSFVEINEAITHQFLGWQVDNPLPWPKAKPKS